MKKILVMAAGFPPAKTYGGPAVSIHNFCRLLCDTFELYVISSDHELHSKEALEGIHEGWNTTPSCQALYMRESLFLYKKLLCIVEEIQPDYIYINSFFSAHFVIPLLRIAKLRRIPLVLAPRGQFAGGALKKSLKKKVYSLFYRCLKGRYPILYQATSDEEFVQIEEKLAQKQDRIVTVQNIPTIIGPTAVCAEKQNGTLKAVYIARIHPIKNLKLALDCLKHCQEPITLDIYGPMEREEYWAECQAVIAEFPEHITAVYKGVLSHDEVTSALRQYDVFLLPTQTENFGHSIVEAMLSGCIPIISDNTPWVNLQDYGCGWSLSLSEPAQFTKALDVAAKEDEAAFAQRRLLMKAYLEEHLDIAQLKEKYVSLFS